MMRSTTLISTALSLALAGLTAAGQSAPPTQAVHPYTTPEGKRDVANFVLGPGLKVGGLIEAELAAGKENGEDVSDLVLATLELGVEADIDEWVLARAILLWEEDGTEPVDLDVASVKLGQAGPIPGFVEAGKLYVPFGTFNSHFISDPLVLELGETRESAVLIGYTNAVLDIVLGAFNGDLDEADADERADDWVASITVRPHETVSFGACWMSDLGEADLLQETLEEVVSDSGDTVVPGETGTPVVAPVNPRIPYETVSGAGGFVSIHCGGFAVEGEYVAAVEDFAAGLLKATPSAPSAWNMELAWAATEAWELALKWEGTEDFPGMPEKQMGACVAHALTDRASLSCEYLHGEYADSDNDRDMVTAQIAVEF